MAQGAQAGEDALHANVKFLAQHGRKVFRRHHGGLRQGRQLFKCRGTRTRDEGIHRRAQRQPDAIQMARGRHGDPAEDQFRKVNTW